MAMVMILREPDILPLFLGGYDLRIGATHLMITRQSPGTKQRRPWGADMVVGYRREKWDRRE